MIPFKRLTPLQSGGEKGAGGGEEDRQGEGHDASPGHRERVD